MKAALLERVGEPLRLVERPEPRLVPGGVVVDVLAVRVPSYTADVFAGRLGYDLPVPLVPGPACIGRVEAVGEDVFDLSPGQIVLCNSLLSSGDLTAEADEILIGWTGSGTARSRQMQEVWRDGSFAQKALYPGRCLVPLPGAERFDRARLPFVASLSIAHAALVRGGLRAGRAVIVNGATGQLGAAGVLCALAQGAAVVVAVGRDAGRLAALTALSSRVTPYVLTGDRATDSRGMAELTGGGAALAVDYLAHTPTPEPTLAVCDSLGLDGTLVLVGGVRHELPLSYAAVMRKRLTVRGSFMFERSMAVEAWRQVASGSIDLGVLEPHCHGLDALGEAMEQAARLRGLAFACLLPQDDGAR